MASALGIILFFLGLISMIGGASISERFHDHKYVDELQKEITEKGIGAFLLFLSALLFFSTGNVLSDYRLFSYVAGTLSLFYGIVTLAE